MSDNDQNISWETAAQKQFEQMIERVPVFLREIAKKKVHQKAEDLTRKAGRLTVTEKDLVDALFAETPFGFHGPMKTDMDLLGIDYVKHGYTK